MVVQGKGGNDHRKTALDGRAPRPGCQNLGDVTAATTWPAVFTATSLAPRPGCRACSAPLPGGRRPHNPRRPPATLWQPCGLTDPECPNSRANPQGWQRVAGGRSGQRGERPPEDRVGWSSTPAGVPEPGRRDRRNHLARSLHSNESGTPSGVRQPSHTLSGGRSPLALNDHRLPSGNPAG